MLPSTTAAFDEATCWLYDRINYEKLAKPGTRYRFTLDRMRDLIERMGHGDRLAKRDAAPKALSKNDASNSIDPRIVHIAGTKGKGSVATMMATMLTAAGYRVGLYTSPHLAHLEERFRVDGQPVDSSTLVDLINTVRPIVDSMNRESIGGPSFFEITTAIAIDYFDRSRCDVWVLETGLGGRLDSTNVFQSDVTLITSIGLDHQHVLGNTLREIASEKAGILKAGVPAISGVIESPAREVILDAAQDVGCSLSLFKRDFDIHEAEPKATNRPRDWGSDFEFLQRSDHSSRDNSSFTTSSPLREPNRIVGRLAVEGRHQMRNAALAIEGLYALGGSLPKKIEISKSVEALSGMTIAARLERFCFSDGVIVILDAAHNPDSIAALIDTLARRFGDRRVVGVFGTSMDKDAEVMLGQLQACFRKIILTQYHGNPRYVPVDDLSKIADNLNSGLSQTDALPITGTWYQQQTDPVAACRDGITAAGPEGVVVVCGSFFLAAEVREWLKDNSLTKQQLH